MANPFIKKQLDFIVNNAEITDIYEIDKIRYVLEVIYGEAFKFIVMILIALLLDKLFAFMLMITLLMLIRPHIGGSHAKSYMSCMINSNIAFLVIYWLSSVIPPINIYIHLIIIILCIMAIRKFKPINPLRKKINTQYSKLKFKDIVTVTLLLWFVLSNSLLTTYYINCGLLVILYIILDFLKEVFRNEKTLCY